MLIHIKIKIKVMILQIFLKTDFFFLNKKDTGSNPNCWNKTKAVLNTLWTHLRSIKNKSKPQFLFNKLVKFLKNP